MRVRILSSVLPGAAALLLGAGFSMPAEAQDFGDILDGLRRDPSYCTKDNIEDVEKAVFFSSSTVDTSNIDLYRSLLECARKTSYWQLYTTTAKEMFYADASYIAPDAIPFGYMKQGKFDIAKEVIEDLQSYYPGDLRLREVFGYYLCETEQFKECLDVANEVLKSNKKTKDKDVKKKLDQYTHSLRMKALFYLGKFKDFNTERKIVSKAEPEYAQRYEKRAIFAEKNKLAYSLDTDPVFPLGIYHLYNEKPKTDAEQSAGYLANLTLYNLSDKARQFSFEVEVEGLTQKSTKTLSLLKGERGEITSVPPLRLDFNVAGVRSNRETQVSIKLYETTDGKSNLLLEESRPLTILPRFHIPIVRRISEESIERTWEFAAAWVTPSATAVQSFLTKAKKFKKDTHFSGDQSASLPQVKALFEAVKASGVSYVINNGVSQEGVALYHEARLPADVLALTNAQCLEGTLLFASLLAAIDLEPVLIFIPGHAFVAWKPTPTDLRENRKKEAKKAAAEPSSEPSSEPSVLPSEIEEEDLELLDSLYFLETTMVHDESFEDAVRSATETYRDQRDARNFRFGRAFMLDIRELQKKQGYKPQPYDN